MTLLRPTAIRVPRLLAVLGVVCGLAGWGTSAAHGYVIGGKRWPGSTITYHNRAVDQQWAVAQAVRAWNNSGANVRLVPTSERNADVILTHFAHPDCSPGGAHGSATLGRSRHAVVHLNPLREDSTTCNRFASATTVAHELGHVLGLGHENRGCAAMNSVGNLFGPSKCPRTSFTWRCRMLATDDIRGAVMLYGGSVRVPVGKPNCPMYAPISRPSTLAVEHHPDQAGIRLSFPRPSEPRLPAFLAGFTDKVEPGQKRGGYAYLRTRGRCPTANDYPEARRIHWSTNIGATVTIFTPVPEPGRHCYAVWAIDRANTPSATPITAFINVP